MMGTVAAIGEEPLIRGFALAGVRLFPASDASEAGAAWRLLPGDVEVVILTPLASQAIGVLDPRQPPLIVVTG
jgi:vacuolar-type H+-ATPase subunit F/Vma7